MSSSKDFLKDPETRKQIMLDHYENPRNYVGNKTTLKGYQSGNINSPSCIDNVTGFVLAKDGKIKDIKFGGESFTICKSSTDIMSSILVGKTINQALDFISNYMKMIDHDKFDASQFD